ncbi:hypothetical protein CVD28_02935 [Bacillus sp. M6-12]|uniref:hypothetical protein n=1 Tax=Bacillus sp. M6-12 TaxID=2054166 RepID=UPI000C761C72|nr:hypothetical protein [Bacillus sp. M6-12]PLS19387.1 hypothetical protein CVD28_02935 [Bacillus sp. M6-12]
MKKKKTGSFLLSCILIGIILCVMWYLYPFSKFGAMVVYDHVQAHNAKSDIQEYVEETHGKNMEIKSFSPEGESRINMVVASLSNKEDSKDYNIYYDVNQDKVLFDEFQFKKDKLAYLNTLIVSTGEEKAGEKYLIKAIEEQKQIISIYEKEMKQEIPEMDTADILESQLDKEYEQLGVLQNSLDALALEG